MSTADAELEALARVVLEGLARRAWSIGIAESLTGGLVVASLVSIPGASAHVRGAVVAYATDLKQSILGVDAALLAAHGPVHPEVAMQMAQGVRRVTSADVGVSTTGIAGPDSPDGQPVGTVHMAVATPDGAAVRSLVLPGDRDAVRRGSVRAALEAVAVSL
ncbi:CinA family protein [Microbacterium sp. ASV49]|uniref:Nicotinamide-nucleotide amidohydrolase family protein n=1 Tax=Microbacterium candidum TaxID=3041922 RepID=A0ABT7N1E0_9MICO|nr:nicotinamide-nucleotide amidohydrolase family protein [Microbacterium sp. ASV49]MDL9980524.1 nicotinamide-nucleotide amidohydrolase family protein [Microbacterium sp. ASV49]